MVEGERREFEKYLERIFLEDLRGSLLFQPRYKSSFESKNHALLANKDQFGNWSSISLVCEVVNESGEFIGPYDCGIDIKPREIENHYDDFLKLKRDKIINKILS